MLTTFLNLVVLISVTKLLHLMVSEVKILQECGKAGKLSHTAINSALPPT